MRDSTSSILRRVLAAGAALAVAAGLAVVGAGSAAAAPAAASVVGTASAVPAAPTCMTWDKKVEKKRFLKGYSDAPVNRVRAGKHACFDRVVIDLGKGAVPGYRVKYVKQVQQPGSGSEVKLKGKAQLEVIIDAASYDFETFRSTFNKKSVKKVNKKVVNKGFHSVKQVAWAGSFEGQTIVGIGVAKKRPFTVSVLKGPGKNQRLVIDIARR